MRTSPGRAAGTSWRWHLYSRQHRSLEAVPLYRRLLPVLEATRFKDDSTKLVPDLEGYADALRMVHDTTAADSVAARAAALR